uniref:Uncharacterized protein n=1 Tax=Anguilla anguilla TaxID=7936 RepID=A0A0E9T609_ANGAN
MVVVLTEVWVLFLNGEVQFEVVVSVSEKA